MIDSPLYNLFKDFGFPILSLVIGALIAWIKMLYSDIKTMKEDCNHCQLYNEKTYAKKDEVTIINNDIKDVKEKLNALHRAILDRIDKIKDDIMNKIIEMKDK